MKRGMHIGVDYFVKNLSLQLKNYLKILVTILELYFLLTVISCSILVVRVNMSQHSPAMRIPMSLIYLAIPVGLSLMVGYIISMNYNLPKLILSNKHRMK